MTGVLRAKVNGVWVDILGSGAEGTTQPEGAGWVMTPGEIGPRYDDTSQARFGHVNEVSDRCGFLATAGGDNLVICNNGANFGVWERTADGTSYRNHANFKYGDSSVYPWRLTTVPHGVATLMPWANAGTTDFTLIAQQYDTILNAPSGGGLHFRIGNSQVGHSNASTWTINPTLSCNAIYATNIQATQVSTSGHVISAGPTWGRQVNQANWDTWGTLSWCLGGAGGVAIAGVYLEGTTACGWRLHYQQSDALYAVGWSNSQHVPVGGLRFDTLSTITAKRDVRALRPEREHITVRLDPAVDALEEPDIMSLRPVVFRYKHPAQRIPKGSTVGEDIPADEIAGAESRRERLGLIGEEVQHVIPSAVSHDSEGNVMGIDYTQVTVALLDHVQRLTDEVGMLRAALAQAHDRIDRLENP